MENEKIPRLATKEEIPIIDLRPWIEYCDKGGSLTSIPEDIKEIAHKIHKACCEVGFFFISEHGVGKPLISSLEKTARDFFSKPESEKMQMEMKKGGRAWRGYFPVGGELTSGLPDGKEGIYFGKELADDHVTVKNKIPMHGSNLFPSGADEMKATVLTYLDKCTELGHRVMALMAISLGLDPSYFRERFTEDPLILFRIFSYPTASNKYIWGVGEHTDYGFLTLLLQDSNSGLEVKTRSNEWVSVPVIDGTFIVNIGDMLEVWTHGLYRSTPHRVRNKANVNRLSFPFFFDPGFVATIEPIPSEKSVVIKEFMNTNASKEVVSRWDGQDVHQASGITYGKYLLNKVSKVFPELMESVKSEN